MVIGEHFCIINGKKYWDVGKASEYLDISTDAFIQNLYLSRSNKHKNKDINEIFLQISRSKIKTGHNQFFYEVKYIEKLKRMLWEQEDFVYRVLIAFDNILEQGIMNVTQLAKICNVHIVMMSNYLSCRRIPSYENAARMLKALKDYNVRTSNKGLL